MNNEDLLFDIEKDIEDDWKNIQRSINNKISKEELDKKIEYLKDNPCRMNFPEFHRFYKLMLDVYINYDIDDRYRTSNSIAALKEMIGRMFSRHGYEYKMSPSFEYIWGMFCDPSMYFFHVIECNNCKKKWDVIANNKEEYELNTMMEIGPFPSYEQMKIYRISCPSCGCSIGSITNKLIGIMEHKEITKEQSNDEEFIRQYLEEGGYDIR